MQIAIYIITTSDQVLKEKRQDGLGRVGQNSKGYLARFADLGSGKIYLQYKYVIIAGRHRCLQ